MEKEIKRKIKNSTKKRIFPKEKLNFKKVYKIFEDYLIITLGLLIYTSAWVIFILPNGLVGGGVSGIGAIIYYITGFEVSYSYFLINLVLLGIAMKVLGKGFGIKTIYGIVVASLFFKILPGIYPQAFIQEIAITNGKLISSIFAGAVTGVGIGMTFTRGGSTGGTDVIALMISKYRNIAPGRLILFMDIIIISCTMLLPTITPDGTAATIGVKLANTLYGFLIIGFCGTSIDLFVNGNRRSVQIFIFSSKYKEIADVITPLKRGVTILSGTGWYTKKEGKILMVVIRKSEMNLIFKMVKEIDSDAFISVGNVMGVYGNGFDKIKK
ncbi:MAG: YitT family protein [Bacteroidales bacterium]